MSGKSYPGWVFMLAGLFIGLFIAFLFFLKQQPSIEKPSLQEAKDKVLKLREEKAKQQEAKDEKPKTDFDFYKILPELEVVIPNFDQSSEEPKAPSVSTKPNTKPSSANQDFILQVGSFSDKSQAEQFKAKLAFLGLQAYLQSVSINNKNWYRVRLGPYSNQQALLSDQKRLDDNKIKSIVLKLKG